MMRLNGAQFVAQHSIIKCGERENREEERQIKWVEVEEKRIEGSKGGEGLTKLTPWL
jgi:hypothetical protein